MRRILITLVLAHVVASYTLALMLTLNLRVPPAETWMLITVLSPLILWAATTEAIPNGHWKFIALVYASYGLGFAAIVVGTALQGRQSRKSRRRRQGLCTECGYDL